MSNNLNTVLGASGATGIAVIKELQNRKLQVRAVQRSKHENGIESVQADLLNAEDTLKAIEGSAYVYLCAAQPYNAKIWLKNWPVVMKNVIDACAVTGANLIFFDNVYMYGPAPLSVPFDENHSQKTFTKKGVPRKQIADMLLQAIEEKKVTALIGRSADFYGPNAVNSMLYNSFLEKMLINKTPMSLANPGIKHTYANTTDNARALVALALEPSAYGQVWHLPVGDAITIEEMAELMNEELGTRLKINFMSPFMRKLLSMFIPILKEVDEMLYQFNNEYVMSFDKFKNQFPDFKVTSYNEGLKEMIKSFK